MHNRKEGVYSFGKKCTPLYCQLYCGINHFYGFSFSLLNKEAIFQHEAACLLTEGRQVLDRLKFNHELNINNN